MVEKLNRDFIPFAFIVPDQEFLEGVPALEPLHQYYLSQPMCRV